MITVKPGVLEREIVRRNMTRAEFARSVLGTTPSYLSQIINGHREPGPDLRKRMQERLGLSFDDLFAEEVTA
ncbi:MAG TPA: helix-turn-helix transcriptional regulator [Chloroflexota bacterium]|jgi:transcriptional regulator with XRE-family HTH domain